MMMRSSCSISSSVVCIMISSGGVVVGSVTVFVGFGVCCCSCTFLVHALRVIVVRVRLYSWIGTIRNIYCFCRHLYRVWCFF